MSRNWWKKSEVVTKGEISSVFKMLADVCIIQMAEVTGEIMEVTYGK